MKHEVNIGVDAGGTLIKVVYKTKEAIEYKKFHVSQLQDAARWINDFDDSTVCITGGKARLLTSSLRQPAKEMLEFEATCAGARYLLEQSGATRGACVLTNVGTGTSIHYLYDGKQRRLGGTGIGGGTLMGLSKLLTGLTDFDDLVQLAAKGERGRIDLTVGHIYEGAEPPIPGNLTASNFGYVPSLQLTDGISQEDLLASVVGLVGETAATVSVLAAAQCNVSSIVFIGSTFYGNPLLKDVVTSYTKLRGASPMFLANGEYCGAIGALQSLG